MLAATGPFARLERRENSNGAEHAARKIADRYAGAQWFSIPIASERHAAAHSLCDQVKGWPVRHRTGLAETRNSTGDDARIHLAEMRIVNPESFENAGAKIADHNIALTNQA